MREFIRLAETLNYSRTALELNTTQSIISRHIDSVEKELGVELLTRSSHKVTLTVAGEIAYRAFVKMVNRYDDLRIPLEAQKSGAAGKLRLGALYYAIDRYYDRVVKTFINSYPQVEVSLHSFQSPTLERELLSNKIDVGLTLRPAIKETGDIIFRNINEEPLSAIFPKTHRLANRRHIGIHELKSERFVFIRCEPWHEKYIRRLMDTANIDIQDDLYAEQIDTLTITLLDHGAVTFVPNHVAINLNHTKLHAAMIEESWFTIPVSIVWLADNQNPSLRLYIDSLKPETASV